MADYPCDVHGGRYAGAATRLYLNVFRDDMQTAFRLSACPDCVDVLLVEWLGRAYNQTPSGGWDPIPDGATLVELLEASSEPRGRGKRWR